MDELTLGQKIRQARLELRLTQEEVAGDFITRNMLSKIEHDVTTPSLKTIQHLARRLNKPISYFLNNEYDKTQTIDRSSKSFFEHASFLTKNNEYKKCISYINQILESIEKDQQNLYHGRLLYVLAKCKIRVGDYNSVDEILDNAIEILKTNNDYYYLSDTYFYKSNVFFNNNKFEKAEIYSKKAIEELRKSYIDDILLEIKLFFSLGFALYKQNKYEESIINLNYAIELSKEYKTFNNFGESYMLLGIMYKKINEIDKAIDCTEKAVSIFHGLDDKHLKAACQKNIGNYYLINNDFLNAEKNLVEALKYFDSNQNHEIAHTIRSDIQELLVKKEDYEKAIEYVNEIDINIINTVDQARIYMNLGNAYAGVGDYNLAKDNLKKAEELLENSNCYDVLHLIYDSYSHMYSSLKDYENAYIYSEKSKEFLKLSFSDKQVVERLE